MNDTIATLCKELRLGKAIAENYGKIQAQTHEEFLEKVLKIETENRKLARKNRYLKQANFEIVKTFENYDFSRLKLPNTVSAEGLKNGNFIDRKENLILYGPVGTGKTHLITAIGVQACDSEKCDGAAVKEALSSKSSSAVLYFLVYRGGRLTLVSIQ